MKRHHTNRVVICGGAYSDNLGDVIIAECLSRKLKEYLPGMQIATLDLAGRTRKGDQISSGKEIAVKVFSALPAPLGRAFFFVILYFALKIKIVPIWRSILKPGDYLVVGGGHLLQDTDLNYPMKLFQLAGMARKLKAKTSIHAVGVSQHWSVLGKYLLESFIKDTQNIHLSVRDDESRSNLLSHLPCLRNIKIERGLDPALLCEKLYPTLSETFPKIYDVGIGIANPIILKLGSATFQNQRRQTIVMKWRRIIYKLARSGLRVALFTNGARADNDFLMAVYTNLKKSRNINCISPGRDGATFVRQIARMRVVVAHRLHAAIVGYALNIPTIGLSWDKKCDSFFNLCHRSDAIVDFMEISEEKLVQMTMDQIEEPPIRQRRLDLIGECEKGIASLADKIMLNK